MAFMQWRVGEVYFLQGERLQSSIFHCNDGYYYHKHHDRQDSWFVTLRCVKRKNNHHPCQGKAKFTRDGSHFIPTMFHNHLPDPFFVEETILKKTVFQAVAAGDPSPFGVIIRNVGIRGGFSIESRSRVTRARLRTPMRNIRLLNMPPIPDTLVDLGNYLAMPHFSHICKSIDSQDSIFAGTCGVFADNTFSVVFVSSRISLYLQSASRIFADGTFKKRPKKPVSSQIFTISCCWRHVQTRRNHIITCVRVLMQRRTPEAYIVLFEHLKMLMPGWNPRIIMCDHEVAQVNGWRQAFPFAFLVTCSWHFAVDVFQYAKKMGLGPYMAVSDDIDAVVRACCALPLLPSEAIAEGVFAMGYFARAMGYMRLPAMRSFFQYLQRQWIPCAAYLSVCNSPDRTNNVSESVNATLALEVRENRPNVWDLLRAFVRLEDQAVVDLNALHHGRNVQRVQAWTTLRNDHRIVNLSDSLRLGNINIVNFLMQASKTLQAPYMHVFEPVEEEDDD